jgi:hypothetical protein
MAVNQELCAARRSRSVAALQQTLSAVMIQERAVIVMAESCSRDVDGRPSMSTTLDVGE